jgi:hypothetical protein
MTVYEQRGIVTKIRAQYNEPRLLTKYNDY